MVPQHSGIPRKDTFWTFYAIPALAVVKGRKTAHLKFCSQGHMNIWDKALEGHLVSREAWDK